MQALFKGKPASNSLAQRQAIHRYEKNCIRLRGNERVQAQIEVELTGGEKRERAEVTVALVAQVESECIARVRAYLTNQLGAVVSKGISEQESQD